MNSDKKLNQIITAALFAAMTCIATMVIRIPTIGTSGYVNIGDTVVLLSAWLLGNPYGALAAGIGSALADLLAGYGSYVPGTAIIKFAMAFVAAIIYKVIGNVPVKNGTNKAMKFVGHIISGVVAELIMVFGYFLYESTLLGYGIGAASSIVSNIIQGVTCLVLALALIEALSKVIGVQKKNV